MADPWEQQEGETSKAFAAFSLYLQQPAATRSIDAAWRRYTNRPQTVDGKRAPPAWGKWSVKYAWLARATAHDAYLAKREQDEYDAVWLERRRIARERDYTQADELRRIIDDALPQAERFIRTQRSFIPGRPAQPARDGQPAQAATPDREVITMGFDVVGLSKVLAEASKLQRLSNDLSTENVELSGAALYASIQRELAQLASQGATPVTSGTPTAKPSEAG